MPIDTGLTGDTGPSSSGGGSGELGSILGALAMAYGVYQGSRNQDKQNRANMALADKQNAANKEIAEYSYSKELEMWNRMNEYNSPASQMQRYSNAGLNPNLIYGQGSSGNASSSPRYSQSPAVSPTLSYGYNPAMQISSALGQFQDFQLRRAQIDNVEAQTAATRAKTITEGLVQGLKGIGIDAAETKLSQSKELFPYQLSVKKGESQRQEALLLQGWKKLSLMSHQEQLMALQQSYLTNRVDQQSVEMEKKQAEALYAQYRNEWTKMGVTSGDNVLLRIFVRMLGQSGLSDQAIQQIKKVGR